MLTCDVVLNELTCRENETTTRCYRCGNAACSECSEIRVKRNGAHRRVRVCNDCLEDDREDQRFFAAAAATPEEKC